MPTTNGHLVNTGCVLDNHFGWHNHARMIEVATGLGWDLSSEDWATVVLYDSGDSDPNGNDTEIVMSLMDDAERWLNDNTPSVCTSCGQPVQLTDSGVWWTHSGLQGDCEYRMMDHAQHYVWHWHDGDFMLSPMCDDGDCDDETCAHWD